MHSHWTAAQIALATGARLVEAGEAAPILHYAYDSRRLPLQPKNTVFLALQGSQRSGEKYVQQAYAAGVRTFWVTQQAALPPDATQIISPDGVLPALQRLATVHRSQFDYPVIAITGSNGKTIVKEWLSSLLAGRQLAKSPRSYNSQLGVALSLLTLQPWHELAIIEAGISKEGEMERLAAMIQPTWGIFTGLGDAHSEGFESEARKLEEKLKLFRTCSRVYLPTAWALTWQQGEVITFGHEPEADCTILHSTPTSRGWQVGLQYQGQQQQAELQVPGTVSPVNLAASWAVAIDLGVSSAELALRSQQLQPVSLRMEMLTDSPELTLLNDAYNADETSVYQALQWLMQDTSQPGKHLILTDLDHQGSRQQQVQHELLEQAQQLLGTEITLIGPQFMQQAPASLTCYASVEDLLQHFDYKRYVGKTVLLKGARSYRLEQLIPYLSRRPAQTELRINLGAITHNLQVLQHRLPAGTGIMAMVKAAAYGSGTWEVAQLLQQKGVELMGVAYLQEGMALRAKGIDTRIVVMNSAEAEARSLQAHQLEPAIGTLQQLRQLHLSGLNLPIHIEVDTGMGRMGLLPHEVPEALELLTHSSLQPASLFTHLVAAENPAMDALTQQQFALFDQLLAAFRSHYPTLPAHVLNSAGVLRFPQQAHQWVRAGLALYGVSPLVGEQADLQCAVSLHSHILRLATYPAGTGLSYNHRYTTNRVSRIATLPLGYADGLPRSMTGASVLVHSTPCPIVGTICMDLLLVDVTDVPEAREGDEVLIFGPELDVAAQAAHAGTIPYELLAGISSRVRRWFFTE